MLWIFKIINRPWEVVMKIQINVSQDECNKLESLFYLTESKSNILTHILSRENFTINEELFEKYCDEYTTVFMSYELAKSQISETYIGLLKMYYTINWTILFNSAIMMIDIDAEGDDVIKKIEEQMGDIEWSIIC